MTSIQQNPMPGAEGQRLDTWLWAARLYKTRAQAKEAIEGGKVRLNGHPAKPASKVRPQDELELNRNGERMQLRVLGLRAERRPASEAQGLYQETPQSLERRERERQLRRLAGGSTAPTHRPDGHARAALRRLRGKA